MKKTLSLLAILGIILVGSVYANAPIFTNGLPDLKLFVNQGLTPAFDLAAFNTSDVATSYAITVNGLGLTSLAGSVVSEGFYSSVTGTNNTYTASNAGGTTPASNKAKWTTYRINKLPKVALNVGDSFNLDLTGYTSNSTGAAVPASFGNANALIVSDPTKVTAVWDAASTAVTISLITASPAAPVFVDIIASPSADPTGVMDADKERVAVYSNLLANGTFATAADTAHWAYELSPKPNLITPLFLATDPAGGGAVGVLDFAFTDNQGGIKMTPATANWASVANDWYTFRARVRADTAATANSHQVYIFGYSNIVGAGIPTSVAAHVLLGVPNTYSWVEIPVYAAAASASGYPQLSIRGGGAGHVYLDEVQMFRGAPTLVDANRQSTRSFYAGGNFNNSVSTTLWGQANYGAGGTGVPAITLSNGAMVLNFAGAAVPPNALGIKWTASTTGSGTGIVTPAPTTIGAEVGGRIAYNIGSGTFSTTPLVIMNLLGVLSDGSLTIGQSGSDIIAAAQLDQLINGTVQAIGNSYSPFYEFQIAIRSPEAGILNITAVDFDKDQDNPYYGDGSLFPF
jgi:hypothetical protein